VRFIEVMGLKGIERVMFLIVGRSAQQRSYELLQNLTKPNQTSPNTPRSSKSMTLRKPAAL
jgi:hypothetical protein